MKNKILCTIFLILCTVNKTNCMELISPTIQDRVITPAIMLGIGAASGAAQAALFNYVNKKNNIDDRCNILRSSATSMAYTLPLVIAHEVYFIDNEKAIDLVIGTEVLKNIVLPTIYSLCVKKCIYDRDSSFYDYYTMQGNPIAVAWLATANGSFAAHRFAKKTKKASKYTRSWGNIIFASGYGLIASAAVFCHFNGENIIKPRFPYQTGA
jgi:hypothetical protein